MAEGKRLGVQRDSGAQGSQYQSAGTLLKLGSARVHCCLTGESHSLERDPLGDLDFLHKGDGPSSPSIVLLVNTE